MMYSQKFIFFFFNDTATTEIYTLSLHDALPISPEPRQTAPARGHSRDCHGSSRSRARGGSPGAQGRSEEHTSELQSRPHLVCRLLLEKKNIGAGLCLASPFHCLNTNET